MHVHGGGLPAQGGPGLGVLPGAGDHVRVPVRGEVGQVADGVGRHVLVTDLLRRRRERVGTGDQVRPDRAGGGRHRGREGGVGHHDVVAVLAPRGGVQDDAVGGEGAGDPAGGEVDVLAVRQRRGVGVPVQDPGGEAEGDDLDADGPGHEEAAYCG